MLSRLASVGWRWTRAWFEFWNELFGDPLHRFTKPAATKAEAKPATPKAPNLNAAPVMVYVEWDSPGRTEIEKLLVANGVKYQMLPVDRDEATSSWLEATVKRHPPVIFVGGDLVGGLEDLKRIAKSGELRQRVFGEAPKAAEVAPLGDANQPAQVYGRRTDTWTNRVTDLLDGKQASYEFVDLDDPRHAALPDRLVQETKRNLTPYVFVRGRYVGGFNAVDELERLGQLDDLLAGREKRSDASGRPRIIIETAERDGDETPPPARN
jgi:glutaredoxin